MVLLLFPVGDENPRATRPHVTYVLTALLLASGVALLAAPPGAHHRPMTGFRPQVPDLAPFLLAPFIPSNLVDALVAVAFLAIFADHVEDRFGHLAYATLYCLWGWIGLLVHLFVGDPSQPFRGPTYGVTGAIGAYVALFPRHTVRFLDASPLVFRLLVRERRHRTPRGGEDGLWRTQHVRAVWVALWWPLAHLFLVGAGVHHGSPVAVLASGLAGYAAGWAGLRWMSIRVADPTLPRELEPVRPERGGRTPTGLPEPVPAPGTLALAAAGPAVPREGETYLEVEPPPGTPPPGPDSRPPIPDDRRFAVIRLTEDLVDVSLLGEIVARTTGESLGDVTRRIRVARGLIARGLPREGAEGIVAALGARGVASAVVDLVRTPPFPPPSLIGGAGCGPMGCVFQLREGRRVEFPWSAIGLVAAAQIESRRTVPLERFGWGRGTGADGGEVRRVEKVTRDTVIDFVLRSPVSRLRLYVQDAHFRPMAEVEPGAGPSRGSSWPTGAPRPSTPVSRCSSAEGGGDTWSSARSETSTSIAGGSTRCSPTAGTGRGGPPTWNRKGGRP
ncbi:MAG: rhomboid family intramembrane serine protease [Planctomycetes bacterium]|nr:rhomboid family intramembrane serine protease [Planctomycetota bacterium]